MSTPAYAPKDTQARLSGALWAAPAARRDGRLSMKVAVGTALLVELLLIAGISHVRFSQDPPPAPKEMRIEIPPPPPPPEVKKIEPPAPKSVPRQIVATPKPIPTPKPPPAKPAPAPKEANIPAAVNPAVDAPALATSATATAPATAAVGAPTAPPALHGVVDGRGHCQSVSPVIPRKALQEGISATVLAHLTIGTDGHVSDVKIIRVTPPTSVFNDAVITAGKAYKCEANAESYVGEVEFSFKTADTDD
jgi:protein TonB